MVNGSNGIAWFLPLPNELHECSANRGQATLFMGGEVEAAGQINALDRQGVQ